MYIDTSAFVKLYVEEPGSEACEATVAGVSLVSSRLLSCEFRSALLNKVSRRTISLETMSEAWQRFESDIEGRYIRFVSLDDLLIQEATSLLNELRPNIFLRTLDALHLATYMSVEAGPLLTTDHRMLKAAEKLGLTLAS